MYDWIGANWIWLLLGIGLLWLMVRPGGMGCGMASRTHDHSDPSEKELPPSDLDWQGDHEAEVEQAVATAHGAHRHGGCC